jgi:hypothetical protein
MRIAFLRIPFRRIPRRRLGEALLVAAFLLAALAAGLRYFAFGAAHSASAGATRLTPAAGSGGAAGRDTAGAEAGSPASATGQPARGTTGPSARVTMPPPVHLGGAAALPSAHVHAGYDSPEDAVDGFYLALLSGTPTRACAYVAGSCPAFGSRPITGFVTVLDATSDRDEALVGTTGSICVGTSCVPLTDRVMMPTGPATFAASWTSLTSGTYGWVGSPLPCVQDSATRQWHVKLA